MMNKLFLNLAREMCAHEETNEIIIMYSLCVSTGTLKWEIEWLHCMTVTIKCQEKTGVTEYKECRDAISAQIRVVALLVPTLWMWSSCCFCMVVSRTPVGREQLAESKQCYLVYSSLSHAAKRGGSSSFRAWWYSTYCR